MKDPFASYDDSSTEQYLPVYDKPAALDSIFKDPDVKHGLTPFTGHELNGLDLWRKGNRFYLHCLARQKKVVAKPEEVVRQLCLKRLLELGYSLGQMSLDRLATSPRSGRERVAQGGAAAATLGTASSVEPARGNGRQNRQFLALSPTVWALAGLDYPTQGFAGASPWAVLCRLLRRLTLTSNLPQ